MRHSHGHGPHRHPRRSRGSAATGDVRLQRGDRSQPGEAQPGDDDRGADVQLRDWLASGRGDGLRHLGWPRLIRALADELRIDWLRARVLDELEAIEALLAGESVAAIREGRDPAVAAALDRLPTIRPEDEFDAAQDRLAELDGCEILWRVESAIAPATRLRAGLGLLEDLDESLAVAGGGSPLSVVELIGVAELCRVAAALAELLRRAHEQQARAPEDHAGARALAALRRRVLVGDPSDGAQGNGQEWDQEWDQEDELATAPDLLADLDRCIERSPPSGDEPRIAGAASPALAQARKQIRARRQGLQAKADRCLRSPGFAEALRDSYWTERDGRVVFPVRSDALGVIRSQGGIIHGSSGSGQTFFVEPVALVEDNNGLREAELEAAEEERKVLARLSAAVAEQAAALRRMQRAAVEIDRVAARLAFSEGLDAVGPQLVAEGAEPDPDAIDPATGEAGPALQLIAARHPLMLLDGVDVVPNDIILDRGHGLVISGPNAGGKTVALKTLGLCALMAAAGLRLPCRRARLPLFRRLITDVGDDQSLTANLSTFSAHIAHVLTALEQAGRDGAGTLVLLDEVAVGTDPQQGAALAEAILVSLVDAGATMIVTTHYDRLKLLATVDPRFHNAAVGFDLQRMRPTFRLSLGVPGSSSAIAVARRLGMPEAVLARAQEILGDEGVRVDELLRDIEAERVSLARTRERIEREQQRLTARDQEVRVREHRLLEGVRSRKAKAYVAAVEQLRALERELKSRRRALREAAPEQLEALPTRGDLSADARAALAAHREADAREAAAARSPEDRLDPKALVVGDKVRVLSMKQDGEIVALTGKAPRKATVQLALLRTTVAIDDLAPLRPETAPAKRKRKRSKAAPILDFRASVTAQAASHFGDAPAPIETSVDNVCDLRGQRFEDAQDRVADFVAEALARDQDVILIRHGHGGGALRKAVRDCLGRLGNVRAHRPGLAREGGDGVTVVWVE